MLAPLDGFFCALSLLLTLANSTHSNVRVSPLQAKLNLRRKNGRLVVVGGGGARATLGAESTLEEIEDGTELQLEFCQS